MRIETREQYDAAMEELNALMERDPHPESEAGVRMIRLIDAIEEYEKKHFPEWDSPKIVSPVSES